MEALDNITQRIKKDAQEKAKKRVEKAKNEAKEHLAKAQKELEKEKKVLEQETEKTIKIQRSRALSEAKLEARKMKLNAKETVISHAFEMANQRFKNLGETETERYFREAISNSVKLLGSDVEVLCNAKDTQLVMRIASGINPKITVNSKGTQYLGGAVIRTKNGTAQIDVTHGGVLERLKNDLRREVAQILFEKKTS